VADPVKVLYILGRGRSGSTILGNVVGAADGFFVGGELRELWDPVLMQGNPCACGLPLKECPVWSQVLDRLEDVDREAAVRWQHEIVREGRLLRLLRYRNDGSWPAFEAFAHITGRLYSAIRDVTGCTVLVDTSKRPSYGAFISKLDGIDARFVHLARDPRASAYSWQSRRYESVRGGEVKRRNAVDATLRWDLLNLGAETLLRSVSEGHGMRLRYEDFAAAPRTTVAGLMSFLGETDRELPFVDERTIRLSENHTIAGNPSRFQTGELVLHDKAEWRTQQDRASRWLATATALPFLRRYRYPIRPSRASRTLAE
jgi:hypothetical protein